MFYFQKCSQQLVQKQMQMFGLLARLDAQAQRKRTRKPKELLGLPRRLTSDGPSPPLCPLPSPSPFPSASPLPPLPSPPLTSPPPSPPHPLSLQVGQAGAEQHRPNAACPAQWRRWGLRPACVAPQIQGLQAWGPQGSQIAHLRLKLLEQDAGMPQRIWVVRIKLTTLGLWDLRAANCAIPT